MSFSLSLLNVDISSIAMSYGAEWHCVSCSFAEQRQAFIVHNNLMATCSTQTMTFVSFLDELGSTFESQD